MEKTQLGIDRSYSILSRGMDGDHFYHKIYLEDFHSRMRKLKPEKKGEEMKIIKSVRRFRRIKKSCGNCAAGLYYGWDFPLGKFKCQRPGGPELNPTESEEFFRVCSRWTSRLLPLEIEEKKK